MVYAKEVEDLQFKRDTDYAVILLCCLGENCGDPGQPQRMTISEIAKKTRIPQLSAGRVLKRLAETDLVQIIKEKSGDQLYELMRDPREITLLTVLEAIEEHQDIFHVFDKYSEVYQNNRPVWSYVNDRVNHLFVSVTIHSLIKSREE